MPLTCLTDAATFRVEVTRDEETMMEITINPEAFRQQANPSTPKTNP